MNRVNYIDRETKKRKHALIAHKFNDEHMLASPIPIINAMGKRHIFIDTNTNVRGANLLPYTGDEQNERNLDWIRSIMSENLGATNSEIDAEIDRLIAATKVKKGGRRKDRRTKTRKHR